LANWAPGLVHAKNTGASQCGFRAPSPPKARKQEENGKFWD